MQQYQVVGEIGIYLSYSYLPNRFVSRKVRAFVDFLVARFGAVPYWDVGLKSDEPAATADIRCRSQHVIICREPGEGAGSERGSIQAPALHPSPSRSRGRGRKENHDIALDQRQDPQGRCRARHATLVGAARLAAPHRHQVRLWNRAVRRLHRAPRRAAGALLLDSGIGGGGQEGHHHRGDRRDTGRQGGAGGVDQERRAAVRLLPVGPDHECERPCREKPRAERRRHRRGDERQHLPLRDVQPDSRRDQGRGRGRERSMIMRARPVNASRREFLRTSAMAGGGLIIGFTLPGATRFAQGAGKEARISAYLRIASNNDITVVCGLSEMGQGVHTAIPMLVAEELDADWSRVRVEQAGVDQAFANPIFGMQATGGSTSVRGHWEPMRKAGAAARAMLIAAAAEAWKADAADCRTDRGMVIHKSGKKLSYGQLAEKAAKLTPPKDVKLKDPSQFTLLGKSGTRRLDRAAKSTGMAKFGLDVYLPGMLTAVIAYPPVPGGKAASVNDAKAKAVPGVRQVVQIPSGVAVLADGYWAAKLGRDALEIQWDHGANASLSSEGISKMLSAG